MLVVFLSVNTSWILFKSGSRMTNLPSVNLCKYDQGMSSDCKRCHGTWPENRIHDYRKSPSTLVISNSRLNLRLATQPE